MLDSFITRDEAEIACKWAIRNIDKYINGVYCPFIQANCRIDCVAFSMPRIGKTVGENIVKYHIDSPMCLQIPYTHFEIRGE